MKHLVNYINESIFGNNIKSAIKINGIEIYEPDWKLCEEYYKKRRKKYFGTKASGLNATGIQTKVTVELGDMQEEYNILYNEDDCIVAFSVEASPSGKNIYVFCPETIYMCHEASCVMGSDYSFSLNDIDGANDFDISFNWYPLRGWTWIGGLYSGNWERKMKEAGFESLVGYIPGTISKKAQDIIKKYTKD